MQVVEALTFGYIALKRIVAVVVAVVASAAHIIIIDVSTNERRTERLFHIRTRT